MTKLAIVGGRDFDNYSLLKEEINELKLNISLIISGGALGADKLGEKYADTHNIPTQIYYPNWKEYGKRAGAIRNKLIVENSDYIIAFWNGISKGTKITIDLAKKCNKKLKIIYYENEN